MDKYRVLLIEDDKTAREQLAKVIEKEGFEIITAEDGQKGLEIFEKERPEIVVTDLKLPHIDGIEVMHTIKRSSPSTEIILITAFGEVETAITALRKGALDYIKKPIDLDILFVALGRAKEKIRLEKNMRFFPTILIVEDDSICRSSVARVLEKEEWRVLQATNGREAMEIFSDKKIDIILLDIKMPQKDGLETLKEMRDITDDFEAIILTGYGEEADAIDALRSGAINFIRKPIDLDHLIVTVEKAIEKLTLKRALKYRTHELNLAKDIISIYTTKEEIIVDIRSKGYINEETHDFIVKLIDAIPLGLAVIEKNLDIQYVNHALMTVLGYKPKKIDREFAEHMIKKGVDVTLESLLSSINHIFETKQLIIEKIRTSKFGYLTMTPISILDEESRERVVLLTIRGERKIDN